MKKKKVASDEEENYSQLREDIQVFLWILKDLSWSIYFAPAAIGCGTLAMICQSAIFHEFPLPQNDGLRKNVI